MAHNRRTVRDQFIVIYNVNISPDLFSMRVCVCVFVLVSLGRGECFLRSRSSKSREINTVVINKIMINLHHARHVFVWHGITRVRWRESHWPNLGIFVENSPRTTTLNAIVIYHEQSSADKPHRSPIRVILRGPGRQIKIYVPYKSAWTEIPASRLRRFAGRK